MDTAISQLQSPFEAHHLVSKLFTQDVCWTLSDNDLEIAANGLPNAAHILMTSVLIVSKLRLFRCEFNTEIAAYFRIYTRFTQIDE